jgi:lysozyme
MQPSADCLNLVKQSEGCALAAYLDPHGVPTIGVGHTEGVSLGMTCTQEQADEWLQEDLAGAVSAVNSLVTVPLTQGQFDALVDFTFNEGSGHLMNSTLLRLLNAGNYQGAAAQFKYWNLAGGEVEPGLVTRRAAEKALFTGATA